MFIVVWRYLWWNTTLHRKMNILHDLKETYYYYLTLYLQYLFYYYKTLFFWWKVGWLVGWLVGWFYGAQRHFQQYFSYIVAVSFIGGGNWSTRRKPLTCHNNVVSSTARLSRVQTHNVSGDRHRLHR